LEARVYFIITRKCQHVFLSITLNVSLLATTSLPFLDLDHDTPLKIIGDAIRYIILWAWKLTSSKM
jgi:hypothetical protein